MALQNFQYDTIMREYSRRQSEVQRALEERRKEAYTRVPRLLEIDQEVASLSARKARALLLGQPASIEELRVPMSGSLFSRQTGFLRIT